MQKLQLVIVQQNHQFATAILAYVKIALVVQTVIVTLAHVKIAIANS